MNIFIINETHTQNQKKWFLLDRNNRKSTLKWLLLLLYKRSELTEKNALSNNIRNTTEKNDDEEIVYCILFLYAPFNKHSVEFIEM